MTEPIAGWYFLNNWQILLHQHSPFLRRGRVQFMPNGKCVRTFLDIAAVFEIASISSGRTPGVLENWSISLIGSMQEQTMNFRQVCKIISLLEIRLGFGNGPL